MVRVDHPGSGWSASSVVARICYHRRYQVIRGSEACHWSWAVLMHCAFAIHVLACSSRRFAIPPSIRDFLAQAGFRARDSGTCRRIDARVSAREQPPASLRSVFAQRSRRPTGKGTRGIQPRVSSCHFDRRVCAVPQSRSVRSTGPSARPFSVRAYCARGGCSP